MITAAAVCPLPPLLLSAYRSVADPGRPLRDACRQAVGEVRAAGVDRLVVVAGTDAAARGASLGFRVARELLAPARPGIPVVEVGVPTRATCRQAAQLGARLAAEAGPVGLLVMADGSARRGPKAPGYLDDRSFGYDDAWRGALRAGDPDALLALDPDLAVELLADGRAALQVLGGAVRGRRVHARVLLEDAPYGVAYCVAVWSCG